MENMSLPERPTSNNPSRLSDELVVRAFARIDKTALGIAVGLVSGVTLAIATLFLVLKGGNPVGPNLALLGQYFIGYTVTAKGSVVGLLYGFAFGFLVGWSIAFLRNLFVGLYIYTVKLKANLSSINDIIGQI